jgi:hypothetical protein
MGGVGGGRSVYLGRGGRVFLGVSKSYGDGRGALFCSERVLCRSRISASRNKRRRRTRSCFQHASSEAAAQIEQLLLTIRFFPVYETGLCNLQDQGQ